ncbi:MAG: hypothetical protein IIW88_08850 [Clostridia bacterium]|nr:hypothetical protein [Clostridia bacterium]
MKKLIAIILSITLIFGLMAMPASAKVGNVGNEDPSFTESLSVSIFDKIGNFFHDLIAKIFKLFGADCPICDNHDGYGEAEGEGNYNKEEVAKMYNVAINKIKMHKTTLRIDHSKEITTKVTELPAVKSAQEKLNAALAAISGRVESGKNFSYNQQSKISNLIPPSSKDSSLSGANVKYIKANNVNDTVKIEFALKDVEAFFDGTVTTGDAVYGSVLTPINLASLEFDGITVTDANISYKDVKIEAVMDNNENLLSLKTSTNFEIRANANEGVNFSATVTGTIAQEYEVTY